MLSTAAVLGAAGDAARPIGRLTPLTLADAICAPAATCACAPRDNLALHRLLQRAAPGSVLVVDAGGRSEEGYFGDLAAIDAVERGLTGLVIDGTIRDGGAVAGLGFPVFHAGFAPGPCAKERALSVGEPVRIDGVEIAPGDQVIADSDAVLVVARADWPEVGAAAAEIEDHEQVLRAQLRSGRRLADLLELPLDEPR